MRYVVFLRAINTGRRRIAMADLRAAYRDAGFGDVETHIASGNVILERSRRPSRASIERVVTDEFGFTAEAFIRSADEVQRVIDGSPWNPAEHLVEVSFLERSADGAASKRLESMVERPEGLVVADREVYFLRAGRGIETSHKEATTITVLGQQTTRRGMATVVAIRDKYLR